MHSAKTRSLTMLSGLVILMALIWLLDYSWSYFSLPALHSFFGSYFDPVIYVILLIRELVISVAYQSGIRRLKTVSDSADLQKQTSDITDWFTHVTWGSEYYAAGPFAAYLVSLLILGNHSGEIPVLSYLLRIRQIGLWLCVLWVIRNHKKMTSLIEEAETAVD